MALGFWAKDYLGPKEAGGSGGGGHYIVEAAWAQASGKYEPVDSAITFEDVLNAWEAGKEVYIKVSGPSLEVALLVGMTNGTFGTSDTSGEITQFIGTIHGERTMNWFLFDDGGTLSVDCVNET